MSEENVELVRRVSALLNSGDWEAAFAYFHPDVEWRDLMHAPDVPEVLYGLDAVRRVLATWVEAYDEFGTEVFETVDADPWVICDTRWYGKGKGSGVVIDVRSADAYEIREGKIVRSNGGYQDLKTALQAVGKGE